MLNDDLRGVLRVQREYDPTAIDIRRVTEMLTWWLKGMEAGLNLSDRDEGMLVQLLERQGSELGLDGRLAAQLFDLDFFTGLSIYSESVWLQSFEEQVRSENLTGWLEKLHSLALKIYQKTPNGGYADFAQLPWPEGVALWAERACFLEEEVTTSWNWLKRNQTFMLNHIAFVSKLSELRFISSSVKNPRSRRIFYSS